MEFPQFGFWRLAGFRVWICDWHHVSSIGKRWIQYVCDGHAAGGVADWFCRAFVEDGESLDDLDCLFGGRNFDDTTGGFLVRKNEENGFEPDITRRMPGCTER